MLRPSRQLSAFNLVVGELIPGREYGSDHLLTLCRAKLPRFGHSTLQSYLRHASEEGVLRRSGRGLYLRPDSQGGAVQPFRELHVDPAAEANARLVNVESAVLLVTQQQALLSVSLDHCITLLRQILARVPGKEA